MDKQFTKGVIEKVRAGDSLTDLELNYALSFYKDLSDKLWVLGLEFKLAWKEVDRTYGTLEAFKRARKRG